METCLSRIFISRQHSSYQSVFTYNALFLACLYKSTVTVIIALPPVLPLALVFVVMGGGGGVVSKMSKFLPLSF